MAAKMMIDMMRLAASTVEYCFDKYDPFSIKKKPTAEMKSVATKFVVQGLHEQPLGSGGKIISEFCKSLMELHIKNSATPITAGTRSVPEMPTKPDN